VLDNAPTYLTFLSAAQGLGLRSDVVGVPTVHLLAVSAGAVLMGANTYIGNGPNFMVKAIAEAAGYRTASFLGYAGRALLILTPLYAAVVVYLRWASGN
jgi:Na+/H+ antiporter NhaD/arsenite permease-like protein